MTNGFLFIMNGVFENSTFDIQPELRVRKMVESRTSWEYSVEKNGDKFGYDLVVYKFDPDAAGGEDRVPLGYIEVEHAQGWETGGIPGNWRHYSFPERKISKYDRQRGGWADEPKRNLAEAVFLKVNKQYDNAFVAPLKAVREDGEVTDRSDGSRTYTFRSLPLGHDSVHLGLDEAIEYAVWHLEVVNSRVG